MKLEDFISLGLDEPSAHRCELASSQELKAFIPKSRFDEVNQEKKKLEADIISRDETIDSLSSSSHEVTALHQTINSLTQEIKLLGDTHATQLALLKIDAAINLAIACVKGKNSKAIKSLLDLERLSLSEDGVVVGLSEQLDVLINAPDSSFLFDSQSPFAKLVGVTPAESAFDILDELPPANMSYEQMLSYLQKNPLSSL